MCGIAGFADSGQRVAAPRPVLAAMAAALAHRGPDGQGLWHDDQIGIHLAHRRLAVIDLTDAAAQPMTGPSGAVVVFNGEIYNHAQLRHVLQGHGRVFQTRSDTEVLLAAFEHWGDDCLDHLVGMFAFAIWQPSRHRLFLARDRLGKKPLYIHRQDRFLAFASEPTALLPLDPIRRGADIDLRSLSDFLSLGYIQTPKSIFANISRLPAGHAASFDVDSGQWRSWQYWDLAQHALAPRIEYDAKAREEFAHLLHQAVSCRLEADVPLGTFLSGGLDSSAVAATAARAGASQQAFVAGFRQSSFDERAFAHQTAAHLGIRIGELMVDPANDGDLARALWHCGEPFADTSLLPTFRLNQVARGAVTVALSGDGADEILAGYPTHRADVLYGRYARLPAWVQAGLDGAARRLLRPSYRKLSFDYKLRQFLAGRGLSPERAHYWWRVVFSEPEKRRIFSADAVAALDGYDPYDTFHDHFQAVKGAGFLDRALYVDAKTWLQDDILVKADRMSMAWGLEVRSPFLDHRLVEFVTRLEAKAKMAGRRQKVVLRDTMAPLLPPTILRRRKQGFGSPTRQIATPILPGLDPNGIFRQEFRLDDKAEDITYKGFALTALGFWFDNYFHYRRDGNWPCPS
ncbi:MAG: asparagine synthase [Rhodospirillaceae bacterium]|nr:MAG: asparagine synthase [Rhodospirillaceae bacterium]TNC97479.1 MAG: asparagine synthase, glutamine-hydrolyzing [Stygiobacter sp.]